MINIACGFICILFMIFGMVDIIRFFMICTMKMPENSAEPILVIPIEGHQENVEYILRAAINKLKWVNNQGKSRVVCLNCGMDDETRKICETLCNDYSCLEIQEIEFKI